MGLTITNRQGQPVQANGLTFGCKTIKFDATYPAGGEVLADSDFGVNTVLYVLPLGVSTSGYVAMYDYAAKKLKLWEGDFNNGATNPLQENTTTDVSAEFVDVFYVGR